MTIPQAGRLDRRIVIQKLTFTQDSFGQPVEVWTDFATVWARVMYPSAAERFHSAALHSERAAVFTIRHRSSLEETMRIYYEGLYWKVTGIRELGRREGYEISGEVIK